MKEQLHTIPISDAMANAGECPFCYIEQKTEEHMMDFVLGHGASYMEADIRDMTDREGFCRAHFKKMFDYGNSLGNAWILKTLMKRHEEEMDHVWKTFRPDAAAKRSSLFGKKTDVSSNSIVEWINRRESTCFICNSVKNTFQAYMKTFFSMYKKDVDFRAQVANTKGFCLDHFKVLCEGAEIDLAAIGHATLRSIAEFLAVGCLEGTGGQLRVGEVKHVEFTLDARVVSLSEEEGTWSACAHSGVFGSVVVVAVVVGAGGQSE